MPASDLPLGLARRTSAVKPVSPATMPAIDTCGPQASAMPSPSRSPCPGFGCLGQLSQASPTPSPSVSAWPGLGAVGQLSRPSPTPSRSASAPAAQAPPTATPPPAPPSAEGGPQASPTPSPSVSVCCGSNAFGQSSQPVPRPSGTPSPSTSPPPTEATPKLKRLPSQRSRAAQVALGLPGKPSKRQMLLEAPPIE